MFCIRTYSYVANLASWPSTPVLFSWSIFFSSLVVDILSRAGFALFFKPCSSYKLCIPRLRLLFLVWLSCYEKTTVNRAGDKVRNLLCMQVDSR